LAALKAGYAELIPGQKLEYRLFQPQDAPGVGRLFYQTYADSYPVDEPYVPELLIEANRTHQFHTIVACTPDGSIAGHAAIYRSSPPNERFYEYGQLMVDKGYRQTSAAFRLHRFAVEHLFGKAEGVDAIYGESVCHHMATQKMIRGSGFAACGLELGLMPESAYAGEGVTGRASCLYAQRVDRDTPGPLHLPGEWGRHVLAHMGNWTLSRQVGEGDAPVPAGTATRIESRHFAFAGVRRVTVHAIGADFAQRLEAEMSAAEQDGAALVQVLLGLGEAWTGFAAQVLRQGGFFWSAYMPLWFAGMAPGPDAVLLQRFMRTETLAGLQLYAPDMQAIGEQVVEDMRRAAREYGAPEAILLPLPG